MARFALLLWASVLAALLASARGYSSHSGMCTTSSATTTAAAGGMPGSLSLKAGSNSRFSIAMNSSTVVADQTYTVTINRTVASGQSGFRGLLLYVTDTLNRRYGTWTPTAGTQTLPVSVSCPKTGDHAATLTHTATSSFSDEETFEWTAPATFNGESTVLLLALMYEGSPVSTFNQPTSLALTVEIICDANCDTCTGPGACTACTAGSGTSGYGLDSGMCVACAANQYSSGTACTDCDANCETCTGAGACTSCSAGYTLSSGQCKSLITLSPPTLATITEAATGTTSSIFVSGDAAVAPDQTVVLTVTSSDPTAATVSPATITFNNNTAPASTSQAVTVTAVDDAVDQGTSRTVSVVVAVDVAATTDTNYLSAAAASTSLVVTDDDAAGITVAQSGDVTTVTDNGSTDSFTLALQSEPTADVTVSMTSADVTRLTVSPATLTFTSSNWATAQTVTVTGADDVDNADAWVFVDMVLTSADGKYDNNTVPLPVAVFNDDTAGITVTQSDNTTTVTDDGSTDSWTAVLTSEPTADVTVSMTSADVARVTVSPATLTFTSSNWATAQTVTVTGVADAADNGDDTTDVFVQLSSTDPKYNGATSGMNMNVSVAVVNDDTAGVTVTQSGGVTSVVDNGSTDSWTVELQSEPTADVTVSMTSADVARVTVSPATLTFTSSNWATAQTVTVTGVADAVDNGDDTTDVLVQLSSTDPKYNGATSGMNMNVSVTVVDDDTAAITVVQANSGNAMVAETGSYTFTVALGSEPTGTVELLVSSSNSAGGGASVTPATLTFNATTWAAAQTVTVAGVDDDADAAMNVTAMIMVAPNAGATADATYASAAAVSWNVTVVDDDVAGVDLGAPSLSSLSSSGEASMVPVRLMSRPSSPVNISFTALPVGKATVSPTMLLFTPDNWNVAQNLTLSASASEDFTVSLDYTVNSASSGYDNSAATSSSAVSVAANLQQEDDDDDGDTAFIVTVASMAALSAMILGGLLWQGSTTPAK